jgi:hypothetical protein
MQLNLELGELWIGLVDWSWEPQNKMSRYPGKSIRRICPSVAQHFSVEHVCLFTSFFYFVTLIRHLTQRLSLRFERSHHACIPVQNISPGDHCIL